MMPLIRMMGIDNRMNYNPLHALKVPKLSKILPKGSSLKFSLLAVEKIFCIGLLLNFWKFVEIVHIRTD